MGAGGAAGPQIRRLRGPRSRIPLEPQRFRRQRRGDVRPDGSGPGPHAASGAVPGCGEPSAVDEERKGHPAGRPQVLPERQGVCEEEPVMSCSSREGTPRLSAEHLVAIGLALASTALLLLSGCVAAPTSSTPPSSATTSDAPKAGVKPVVFEKEAAQASNELHTDRRLVEVPVDRARLGGKKVELWVTSDLGQNWTNHGESEVSKASVSYLAPRDGRYGFRVVPVDAEGRRELTPKSGDAPERTVVVDTVPPVVEVLSPNGGEVLGAGRSTVVQWVAQDVN